MSDYETQLYFHKYLMYRSCAIYALAKETVAISRNHRYTAVLRHALYKKRASSSNGRASALHAEGYRFESDLVHQLKDK